jgi:hypothetical protein
MTAFDAANSTIDQQRSNLLAAIAKAGSAGRAAYEAAQADLGAQRTSAIQSAVAAAGGRGAPAAVQGQVAQTVGQPYERGIASLRMGQASREGDLAARQANTDSYLSEVKAAVPVTRALAERQLAELRARATKESASSSLASGRLALDREKFEYEKSQAGRLGADLSDSELSKRLMGVAELRKEQAKATPTRSVLRPGKMSRAFRDSQVRQTRATPTETLARRAGVSAGIDPARVYGVVPAPKPAPANRESSLAKKIGVRDLSTIRTSTAYKAGVEAVDVGLQGGMSLNDFKRFINADPTFKGKPKTVALLLEEYGRQFPSSQPPTP